MADYRKRLAERLENEREGKSLSREALALEAGVSYKTIKRIEEQRVDQPRQVTIRRLAKALGIEPSKLRPPPELEEDQLNRMEDKIDALIGALREAGLAGLEDVVYRPDVDSDGPQAEEESG